MPCPRQRMCGNGGNSWSYSWSTCNGVTTYKTTGNVPAQYLQQGQPSSACGQKAVTNAPETNHSSANAKAGAAKDYYEYGLQLHNWYRKRHGSPKLVLNDRLNKAADAYAYKLACRRQLVHNSGLDYGENLYMSSDTRASKMDHVRNACKAWYDENKLYNYGHGGFSMQTGHFTAMVWKSTTLLGIGCWEANGCVVVVANYKVFPNMQGQFQNNVLPYRDVEDTDDEEEEIEEKQVQTKKGETKAAPKSETSAKIASDESSDSDESDDDEDEISSAAREAFKEMCDSNSTIGWSELKEFLNKNVQVDFGFEGFDKCICSLMISMITIRTGEKKRVGVEEFGKILRSMEGFLNAYTEFDIDNSGLLDPFEFKAALKEAGFDISYRTFQTLQKVFATEDGNMDFKSYVCCFVLLAKLQIVQEKRKGGAFEDFSLKDWMQGELEAASKE